MARNIVYALVMVLCSSTFSIAQGQNLPVTLCDTFLFPKRDFAITLPQGNWVHKHKGKSTSRDLQKKYGLKVKWATKFESGTNTYSFLFTDIDFPSTTDGGITMWKLVSSLPVGSNGMWSSSGYQNRGNKSCYFIDVTRITDDSAPHVTRFFFSNFEKKLLVVALECLTPNELTNWPPPYNVLAYSKATRFKNREKSGRLTGFYSSVKPNSLVTSPYSK